MRDFKLTIAKIVIILAIVSYVAIFRYAVMAYTGIPIAFLLIGVVILDAIVFLTCVCIYKMQTRMKTRAN